MNNRIRKLNKEISNKIAAGEVIDRPASVVKELIENSVDAMSNKITVEIKNAGKTLIRVSDNGIGIHKDDILLAFERHATSKIYSGDDIYNIKSLGFRGEALSSILSVSDVEIITKTKDEKLGIKAEFVNGKMVKSQEVGCPQGTTIFIKDLFYNTPARFKFLKSDSTETKYISTVVNNLALSHPEISIRYIIDNKLIFVTQAKGDIQKLIYTLYGKEVFQNLLEIKGQCDKYKLKGFISNINYSKGNKQLQLFFVNGRYIKSKILSEAVTLAYKTLLPAGRYPVCFIYLEVPYNSIDVNIHPSKTEIRFNDEELIKDFVYKTIKEELVSYNLIPEIKIAEKIEGIKDDTNYKLINNKNSLAKDLRNFYYVKEKNNIKEKEYNSSNDEEKDKEIRNLNIDDYLDNLFKNKEEPKTFNREENNKNKEKISQIKIIGQLFSTYILGEQDEKLILIDQHAAHERILYDNFLENYKNKKIYSQVLIEPEVMEISYLDKKNITENTNFFKSLGYQIEDFGYNTIIIREIPMIFDISSAKAFLKEVLENIDSNNGNIMEESKIISESCKKAIKAHDKLDNLEIKSLLKELSELTNPYTCPHGRPIIISISKEEIEKKFKRT